MTWSVAELRRIVLTSDNGAWRDDAADALGKSPDRGEAQAALLEAIQSPSVDDSLRQTCAESLAELWIAAGAVDQPVLRRLRGMPGRIVETLLGAANLPFERDR